MNEIEEIVRAKAQQIIQDMKHLKTQEYIPPHILESRRVEEVCRRLRFNKQEVRKILRMT